LIYSSSKSNQHEVVNRHRLEPLPIQGKKRGRIIPVGVMEDRVVDRE